MVADADAVRNGPPASGLAPCRLTTGTTLASALGFLADGTTQSGVLVWSKNLWDGTSFQPFGSYTFFDVSIRRGDGAVPEPGALGLACIGLVGLARRRLR